MEETPRFKKYDDINSSFDYSKNKDIINDF